VSSRGAIGLLLGCRDLIVRGAMGTSVVPGRGTRRWSGTLAVGEPRRSVGKRRRLSHSEGVLTSGRRYWR
jgi:hypothetical protein